MTTSNSCRTGTSTTYEIEVFNTWGFGNDANQREIMDGLRILCADLIEGIDQSKAERGDSYGEDGMDHSSIFVEPGCVGEAVRRINEAGWATDEDEVEEEEELDIYEGLVDE
jgi:hypothetical protein